MQPVPVMFVAGDPSGDIHASFVIRRLREIRPAFRCFGIGGPAMTAAGFSPILPFEPFNRMGFAEVAAHLGFFMAARRTLIRRLRGERPAVLVLVDYPGFNMAMLKAAARLSIPVVWYIAPKVWAWKKKRAAVLSRLADRIAVIFPFEVELFERLGGRVAFVGNPLVEALGSAASAAPVERALPERWTLGLVPGSRQQEVERILPVMLDAFRLLRRRYPRMTGVLSRCAWLPQALFDQAAKEPGLITDEGPLTAMLDRCDLAIVTSGTATLETALAGVPQVIVYRTSALTWLAARAVVRIRWIGLPNIISRETVVPECIQGAVTGERLAREIGRFVDEPEYLGRTRDALAGIREKLGSRKPSEDVAAMIAAAADGNREREKRVICTGR